MRASQRKRISELEAVCNQFRMMVAAEGGTAARAAKRWPCEKCGGHESSSHMFHHPILFTPLELSANHNLALVA